MENVHFKNGKLTITFDKVPDFIYINDSGNGCGRVYVEGKKFKGIQRAKFESETNTDKLKPLKYSFQHISLEVQKDGSAKPIIEVTGNMNECVKEIE